MTLGERVRAEREAHDWSQAELARRVSTIVRRKISQVAIHHIESRGNVSPRFVVELAQALEINLSWLRSGRGPKGLKPPPASNRRAGDDLVTLPVSTIVGAGDEITQAVEGDEPFDEEAAPPDLADGEVTEVRGRSMLPLFRDGDRLFHRFLHEDPTALIGEAVVARLKDGRRFVKVLQTGSRRGLYKLESINPAYEPMQDLQLDGVAEIVWVKKRSRAKKPKRGKQ